MQRIIEHITILVPLFGIAGMLFKMMYELADIRNHLDDLKNDFDKHRESMFLQNGRTKYVTRAECSQHPPCKNH